MSFVTIVPSKHNRKKKKKPMSLVSMPFVDTGFDMGLHIVAAVVLVATVAAAGIGFWKLHELPINKAHRTEHQQVGLITALTWIGFIWHWVWVLAVIVAFVDAEQALCKVRDIWKGEPSPRITNSEVNNEENKSC